MIRFFTNFCDHAQQILNSNEISGFDGIVYNRREFRSPFHQSLDLCLSDPEKVQIIVESYESHLQGCLSIEERVVVEKWILQNVSLLGSLSFFAVWEEHPSLELQKILETYPKQIQAFLHPIHDFQKAQLEESAKDASKIFHIVIITTGGGGGHKNHAEGIAQILQKFPHRYRVTVIDVAPILKKSDAIYLMTGRLNSEEVYDQVFQQHKEIELAHRLWALNRELRRFIPDCTLRDLKKVIRPLHADLIISTCHFLPRDLEVGASLGVPIRFAHCDYELSWALMPLIYTANSQLVKLWLPDSDPELLTSISSQLKTELMNGLEFEHNPIEIDLRFGSRISQAIEYPGYATRSSYKREYDPVEIQKIRKRLYIKPDQVVIPIQMGRQGVANIFAIVKILNESISIDYGCNIILPIFCGKNTLLRKQLTNYLVKSTRHPQIQFRVLSEVSQELSADYMKVSRAEVIKPGGATTAEAGKMGLFALIIVDSSHNWEGCNKNWLVRRNLGIHVENMESLPKILQAVVKTKASRAVEVIDAETEIPKLVDKAVTQSRIFQVSRLTSEITQLDHHEYFSSKLLQFIEAFPFEEYRVYSIPEEGSFYLDSIGDWIKDRLRQGENCELQIKALLQKYCKPGSHVIDVGAHIGIHSMRMARFVGPEGKVSSFEPQPKTVRELIMNRRRNGHTNMQIFPVALGNANGSVELSPLLEGNEGGTSIGKGGSGYFAPLRTLDSFQFSDVSLMKVDVELMEDAFLEGAKNTIIRNKPVILIEIMAGHDHAVATGEIRQRIDNTIHFLEQLGYVVERIHDCDYIAIPQVIKSKL
ncbi:MAG: FkbM family methyltransferase [Chlamydiae bacterium]|nr:FkbM family methyltransferase [Chlamydiota bacterium]